MASANKTGSEEKGVTGQEGVRQEQVGSGKKDDPNNFANDREQAAAASRKGGHESHKRD